MMGTPRAGSSGRVVGQRLFELVKLGFEIGDHAATVGAAAYRRWRSENLQLATDLVSGLDQLLAQRLLGV